VLTAHGGCDNQLFVLNWDHAMKRVFQFVILGLVLSPSSPVLSQSKPVDIQWVRIPGGSFIMGSTDNVADADEKAVHPVKVPTFEISKTEVTVNQYMACVVAGACTAPNTGDDCNWGKSGRGNHPINCVDWQQAQVFANWAGGRLPTEAEWEYAARSGGRDWKYPWGNEEATCALAVKGGCGHTSTTPVCGLEEGNTSQGLCDMAGNVWEWVQDWYHDSYKDAPNDGSAWVSPLGTHRVVRGGAYRLGAQFVRSAKRGISLPSTRDDDLGFRLAKSVR